MSEWIFIVWLFVLPFNIIILVVLISHHLCFVCLILIAVIQHLPDQQQSATISNNQQQSATINNNQQQSATISNNQQSK